VVRIIEKWSKSVTYLSHFEHEIKCRVFMYCGHFVREKHEKCYFWSQIPCFFTKNHVFRYGLTFFKNGFIFINTFTIFKKKKMGKL